MIELIESLGQEDLFGVVLAAERPQPDDLSRLPVAPEWLVEVVLRRGLSLMAAELDVFAAVNAGA